MVAAAAVLAFVVGSGFLEVAVVEAAVVVGSGSLEAAGVEAVVVGSGSLAAVGSVAPMFFLTIDAHDIVLVWYGMVWYGTMYQCIVLFMSSNHV
jgi:hypothetical protein